MNKRAIDIVLLPSEEITEAALRLNRELRRRFEKKIVLNQDHSLPHLSLAMGGLKEEALPAACTSMSTSFAPGAGRGRSPIVRTSGPPNAGASHLSDLFY